MKKKIVLLMIVFIVLVLIFIGRQAYSEYKSEVRGKGTADLASWSFKVNENKEEMQNITLESTLSNQTLVNNKIAPGTEGSFQINLDATGADVGINYVIKFENETQKPTNLKFEYNGKIYNYLEELQKDLTGIINANEENKIINFIINWNWKYETGNTVEEIEKSDIIDTQDAKQITDYNFDIVVTGTQVIPDS